MKAASRSTFGLTLFTAITLAVSSSAAAQQCPAPVVGSDGFWSIKLPTVELKMRPGETSSDLVLTQLSPLTGETETQTQTIIRDGAPSERSAILQVNTYGFDHETLTITSDISAVLAAGYTPSGALSIGYGASEGGFLVLIDGDSTAANCLPYPANAAFGDSTKAISIVGFDIREIGVGLATRTEQLRVCQAQTAALQARVTDLTAQNAELEDDVTRLTAELTEAQKAANRRIFNLSRVIRSIFNDAQDGVKRQYPGDRQALSALRKQLVVARKANRRNITSSSNVITADRTSVR